MTVTATGPLSLPLTRLQDLLAATATLQTWVGHPGNAAAARESVYIVGLDEPVEDKGMSKEQLAEVRPFVFLDIDRSGQGYQTSRIAGGAGFSFQESGKIMAIFEQAVPDGYTNKVRDAEIDFLNTLGGIISEVKALAATGAYLRVHGVDLMRGPFHVDEDDNPGQGRSMFAELAFHWGTF